MSKIVEMTFTVTESGQPSPEFASKLAWNDCNWGEVTFLQDVVWAGAQRTIDAGYELARKEGMTDETIAFSKALARKGEILTSKPAK